MHCYVLIFFTFFHLSFEILAIDQRNLQAKNFPTSQPSTLYVAPTPPEDTVTKVPSPTPIPNKKLPLKVSIEKQNITTTVKKNNTSAEKLSSKDLKVTTINGTTSSRNNNTTLAVEDGKTFSKRNNDKDMKKEIERIEVLQYRLFFLILIFAILGVTYLIRKWQPLSQ